MQNPFTTFVAALASRRGWLLALLGLLTANVAQAQLAGTYTIDPAGAAPPTTAPYPAGTNFQTFTQAITALNQGGVSAPVTFNVAKVTYTEPTGTPALTASGTATNTIVFQESPLTPTNLADNPTVTRTAGLAVLTDNVFVISGGDYITFDGINVAVGAATVEFGYVVRNASATNGATNNTIRNARVVLDRTNTNSVGVLQSSSNSTTAGNLGGGGFGATSANGLNANNTYQSLTVENAYRGISLVSNNTAAVNYDLNTQILDCTIGSGTAGNIGGGTLQTTGILVQNQSTVTVRGNVVRGVSGTGTTAATSAFGIYINEVFGTANYVYNNRILGVSIAGAGTTGASVAYGLVLDTDNSTAGTPPAHRLTAYNNFVADVSHSYAGTGATVLRAIGMATQLAGTGTNNFIDVYHNSVSLTLPAGSLATSTAFASLTSATNGPVLTLRNNIFANTSGAQTGNFQHFAITSSSATLFGKAGSTSDFNDLYVSNAGGAIGSAGPVSAANQKLTLANWRAAYPTSGAGGTVAIDNSSVSADPNFVSATDLHAAAAAINNLGTPLTSTAPGLGLDIDGQPRSATTPDIGADEFTPAPDDVALVSIDSPTSPAAPGASPVTVTIRNTGAAVLTTLTLSYVLNAGAAVMQTFTGLTLASNATQQLSFSTPLLTPSGSNTLVVTATLPNGQTDPTPGNNSQTLTFVQPTPSNDEPCNAVALGNGPTAGSNSGASTSLQPGIVLPACAPSAVPRDVWFSFVATGNGGTLTLTGPAAGMVRVFTTPDCQAGPFALVLCRAAAAANTGFTAPIALSGLVPGATYYVAVSGYSSSDPAGPFSIQATFVTAARAASEARLAVFPNPSGSGQLTLRLPAEHGAGTVELLNALGQTMRTQTLAGGPETTVATQGLAAGLYTLRVQTDAGVVARRVVLE